MTDGQNTPITPIEVTDATAEKPRRRRRTGLWLGIGIPGVLAVGAVAVASSVLIAPGVAVAGTPVGFHTEGQAVQAIENRVADAKITIGNATVTGAELGATVNAEEAAKKAFADHPLWKITDWNPQDPYAPKVTVDPEKAAEVLRAEDDQLFVDPVDAQVVYDEKKGAFVAKASQPGTAPDVSSLGEQLSEALVAGSGGIEITTDAVEVAPSTETKAAKAQAKALNGTLHDAGFYVDGEEVVDITGEQLASWIDVKPNEEGAFSVNVDEAAIQKVVKKLPEQVDRAPVDGEVIVNTAGDVLRGDAEDGRKLASTKGIAKGFAESLAKGEGAYELKVETVKADITKLERRLVADLSDLKVYAYENGKVVKTFPMSPGKAGNETDQGNFTVYAKLDMQNMGNEDTTKAPYYYTPNVKYVMYFNGSEGFHGTYWHNEFGIQPMSHGCVNLSEPDAKWLYDWTPYGTEVQVRA